MTDAVRFLDLQAQRRALGERLDAALQRVLDHGSFILGAEVSELEDRLAAFAGAAHAVTCGNGTDALLLAMLAQGIGPGDAVFVPTLSFVATAEAAARTGATPVFVDVRPDAFDIDPHSLAAAVPAAARLGLTPRMVVAVDLYGHPADYPAIDAVAARHGLSVLADAAQSFGATLGNDRVGRLAPCTTTSFFPAKPLGCFGDGGAVLTDDDSLAEIVRSLALHGRGRHKYDAVRIGANSRLDTLQAAVLLAKLSVFEAEITARNAVAERYSEALADVTTVPRPRPGVRPVWAMYVVLVDDRDRVQADMAARGVQTMVHYPAPIHHQAAYADFPVAPGGAATAESVCAKVLSLPMHAYLDEATQDRIVAAFRAAVGAA